MNQLFFVRTVFCLSVLFAGCAEPAGTTLLAIVNESDQALTYELEQGAVVPEVLATDIQPAATTDILRSGGCFGCSHPPQVILSRFTILRADAAVVLELDPVMFSDWTLAPRTDGYDSRYTLTVTQAEVDAAMP